MIQSDRSMGPLDTEVGDLRSVPGSEIDFEFGPGLLVEEDEDIIPEMQPANTRDPMVQQMILNAKSISVRNSDRKTILFNADFLARLGHMMGLSITDPNNPSKLKGREAMLNAILYTRGGAEYIVGLKRPNATENDLSQLTYPQRQDLERAGIAVQRDDPSEIDDTLRSLTRAGRRPSITMQPPIPQSFLGRIADTGKKILAPKKK